MNPAHCNYHYGDDEDKGDGAANHCIDGRLEEAQVAVVAPLLLKRWMNLIISAMDKTCATRELMTCWAVGFQVRVATQMVSQATTVTAPYFAFARISSTSGCGLVCGIRTIDVPITNVPRMNAMARISTSKVGICAALSLSDNKSDIFLNAPRFSICGSADVIA